MSKANQAVAEFKKGFACSQSVFSAFSQDLGLDQTTALKLSSAFGGGMAKTNQTCGAVTGAYLALGLKHGRAKLEDEAARTKTYALIQEFDRRFKAKHKSVNCTELLGFSLGDPAQYQKAAAEGRFKTICAELVRSAVEIAEEII